MNSLLPILCACVDTKFVSVSGIVAWAENLVMRIPEPQYWLLELTGSRTAEDALRVLHEKRSHDCIVSDDQYGALCVGLWYLRFVRGEITYSDLEGGVTDDVDAYPFEEFDIEYFQAQFSRAGPQLDPDSELGRILRTCGDLAERSFSYAFSDDVLSKERALLDSAAVGISGIFAGPVGTQ